MDRDAETVRLRQREKTETETERDNEGQRVRHSHRSTKDSFAPCSHPVWPSRQSWLLPRLTWNSKRLLGAMAHGQSQGDRILEPEKVHRLWGPLCPAAQIEGGVGGHSPVLRLLQEVRQALQPNVARLGHEGFSSQDHRTLVPPRV